VLLIDYQRQNRTIPFIINMLDKTGSAIGNGEVTAAPKTATFEAGPTPDARRDLLEFSPDEGALVGKLPAKVASEILSLYHGEKNPLKAIRARCLDCCCQQPSEVRKCVAVNCPSWPFRMGTNPFRAKRVMSPERRREMAERLLARRPAANADRH
jgi:hypothetical protein